MLFYKEGRLNEIGTVRYLVFRVVAKLRMNEDEIREINLHGKIPKRMFPH